MAYSFHLSFYATGLRGDDVEVALSQLAPIAARYGSSHWGVYRSQDDLYKFLMVVDFPEKKGWERFWNGEECQEFRIEMSGAYQNPVLYVQHAVVTEGNAVVSKA